jgi:hypothetical protein
VRILTRPVGGEWKSIEETGYELEADLQALLNEDPDSLIPRDKTVDRSVVYAREVLTTSGRTDLVGIGSSGSLTIMECKLARNPQVKREVVGQVLDYAAALWMTELDDLIDRFRSKSGNDPFVVLRESYPASAEPFDETACRTEVQRRLGAGDFTLAIAVDRVDDDLKRIVQFVNSRPTIGGSIRLVALSYPRFSDGTIEILVPEAFGDEIPQGAPGPGLTDVQQQHLNFWNGFSKFLELEGGGQFRLSRPVPAALAIVPTGIPGLRVRPWRLAKGQAGLWLDLTGPDRADQFGRLLAQRARIDSGLGPLGSVEWPLETEGSTVRIGVNWADQAADPADYDRLYDWLRLVLNVVEADIVPILKVS